VKPACRDALPLPPLLHAYVRAGVPTLAELHQLPGLGPRFAAVLSATARFLFADFLDLASDDDLRDALGRFYTAVVPQPLHLDTLRRRAGFVRYALGHLLRGEGPLPQRLHACLSPGGAYRVPGLGPAFWSAVVQGLAPARHPGWTPATQAGLDRLSLPPRSAPGAGVYSRLLDAHARARALQPSLSALHVDHFFALLAVMPGRNLTEGAALLAKCPVAAAVRRQRARTPLRQRLKGRGQALASAQQVLEEGLRTGDGKKLGDALAVADPHGAARCPLDWGGAAETLALWAGRLWEADDPYPLLRQFWADDPLPAGGLWLPAAVLHLRDPQRFAPYADEQRQGHARIDDGVDPADEPAERYRLFNEAVAGLREKHALHPLETADVLAELADAETPNRGAPGSPLPRGEFRGFCADTFAFLAELARENRREWMEAQRDRYRFAVRGPLAELCRTLAARYVGPVLGGTHGWRLDAEARSGRALTSICKNGFGKGLPYNSALWIAFCPPGQRGTAAQLFVRLGPEGVRYGLRLGGAAQEARARLRAAVAAEAAGLFRRLEENGALAACKFGPADQPDALQRLDGPGALSAWAAGRSLEASCARPAGDPLLYGEELAGEVLLTFDRLLPLYAAAALTAPLSPAFAAANAGHGPGYGEAQFTAETFLGGAWLRRALDLLALKKQLILQGPPGVGKTHVARCLARLLAGGREACVRLVQFHPAYSYEEFVEGIKVKSVAVRGRHDLTYPVEEGLLCSFAGRAAAEPSRPHVLVVDEINRGNLPRIFGELLYLLEYRGQAVELPYSRRAFHLPENLYLLATMNAADRSIALVDQALRRRFSFLEMEPDAAVLAAWLGRHPPAEGPAFVGRVLQLFDRLNASLRADLGPHARIGHSFFMAPALDEAKLRMVWRHHVRPVIDEHFSGQPGRAAAYDQLLDGEPGRVRPRAGAATG
jgi:hypothetical protein